MKHARALLHYIKTVAVLVVSSYWEDVLRSYDAQKVIKNQYKWMACKQLGCDLNQPFFYFGEISLNSESKN
jgi:hypothetical protein